MNKTQYKTAFKNICENLANIYQIYVDNDLNNKNLDSIVSKLYNELNKTENELNNLTDN